MPDIRTPFFLFFFLFFFFKLSHQKITMAVENKDILTSALRDLNLASVSKFRLSYRNLHCQFFLIGEHTALTVTDSL